MKALQDLTLLNKFLFDEIMDIPEAHEATLQIILQNEDLQLLIPSQTEKEIRTMPWLRSIRLDVFAVDQDHVIYNTEMQQEQRSDLAKRSRYYQSLIDSSLLEPGSISFNLLNNTYVIMITPFDLFGLGKYQYTFKSYCEEDKSLELQDGAIRIFLNTRGTNDHEVSQELIEFLHYVEKTDDETAERTHSRRIRQIHKYVQKIKSSEEMGVKYMQKWEEKILDWKKGKSEGLAQGRSEGISEGELIGKAKSIIDILRTKGSVPDTLQEYLLAQRDMSVLTELLLFALNANSVQEFSDHVTLL